MTAYLIVNYDVTDAAEFEKYNPGSLGEIMGTIAKHGGTPLGAGPTESIVGSAESVCVLIQFPDSDAAKAWLDDDEYAPLKALRHGSTSNIREFLVPGLG